MKKLFDVIKLRSDNKALVQELAEAGQMVISQADIIERLRKENEELRERNKKLICFGSNAFLVVMKASHERIIEAGKKLIKNPAATGFSIKSIFNDEAK